MNGISRKLFILTSMLLALIVVISMSACGKEDGKTSDTDKAGTTDISKMPEDYVPEGVDVNYTMDYMNEDLTSFITLGEYKGLSAEVKTYVVDEEYIDEVIDDLLVSKAEPEQITDRKTAEGDIINIDYVGTLDGVAFSGGSASNVDVTLSSDSGYIPGFVEGMYDVMPGETVSYDVTFPEVYPNNPNLAGKKTVFTVTVHYIKGENKVPELNDAFVEKYFGSEGVKTVDTFMVYYKSFLESERLKGLKDNACNAIWGQIVEGTKVISLPEKSVEAFYWLNRANYEYYAASSGLSYEEFLAQYGSYSGMGTDDDVWAYAETYIKEDMVIYSIVKAENLQITDEEYAKGIAEFCEQYGMSEAELVEAYGEDRIESVLIWNKLMDAIYEWSNITVVTE